MAMRCQAAARGTTLGDIALVRGDLNTARAHFLEEGDKASRLRGLAIVDMKLGRAAAAEAAYAELLKEGGDTVHYQQAQVLAQWGRKDDALKQLEQALTLRDAGLVIEDRTGGYTWYRLSTDAGSAKGDRASLWTWLRDEFTRPGSAGAADDARLQEVRRLRKERFADAARHFSPTSRMPCSSRIE